jgi:outer membrane receptor protein involved in Fe transport
MIGFSGLKAALAAGVCAIAIAGPALAQDRNFDIPPGDLKAALDAYIAQSGDQLIFRPEDVAGRRTHGAHGHLSSAAALDEILDGTGLTVHRDASGAEVITPQGPATKVSEITVTGTHIAGRAPTSPVITVDRQQIETSGLTTLGDVIRNQPAAFSGGINPGVNFAHGSITNQPENLDSTINLRGLGPDATLTLVNGHRFSYDGSFGEVDISSIPLAAVDHIDLLTDGASAIYGSDAVAGVANIVLRKNYDGAQSLASMGFTADGGGQQEILSQLVGKTWDQGSFLLGFQNLHQTPVYAYQRSFTRNDPFTPTPYQLTFGENQNSAIFSGHYDITPNVTLSLDAMYNDRWAPLEAALPFSPGVVVLEIDNVRTRQYAVTPSLTFKLPGDWTAAITGDVAGANDYIYQAEVLSPPGLVLDSGNFFNVNRTQSGEITAQGPLIELPSGKVHLALGAGYRAEQYQTGEAGVPAPTFDRSDRYAYAEALIPLAKQDPSRVGLERLELSLAGRYDDYDQFGGVFDPKVGLLWQVTDELRLKGGWGKAFKAPTLLQEHQSNYVYVLSALQAGLPGAGAPPGDAREALIYYGGNPKLNPERSTTWNISADYSPSWAAGLKATATYFHIDYDNRITQVTSSIFGYLQNPYITPYITPNPSPASQAADVASSAAVFNFSGEAYVPANVVALLDDRYVNTVAQKIQGVDLALTYSPSLPSGHLTLMANATWLESYQRLTALSPVQPLAGSVFFPTHWKARAGAAWSDGPWSASLFGNYVGKAIDNYGSPHEGIGDWFTVDAQVGWRVPDWNWVTKGARFTVSAQNLLDRSPPAVRPTTTFPGYDSTNVSPIGRFVTVAFIKDW